MTNIAAENGKLEFIVAGDHSRLFMAKSMQRFAVITKAPSISNEVLIPEQVILFKAVMAPCYFLLAMGIVSRSFIQVRIRLRRLPREK